MAPLLLFSALIASTAALGDKRAEPSLFDLSTIAGDASGLGRTAKQSVNDPLVDNQWHLDHIHMGDAWATMSNNLPPEPRKPVVMAVLFGGMDVTHPDLKDMLWSDSKRRHGYNFIDGDYNLEDLTGDGTMLSGILGAQLNNSKGVAGVAGIRGQLQLMTLKLDITDIDQIMAAISYAKRNGANVVYIPWGSLGLWIGYEKLLAVVEAATEAGMFFVSAAGNRFTSEKEYPCAFKFINAICVAGTTKNNILVPSSNFGNHIDVAAPGEGIFTTADKRFPPGKPYAVAPSSSAAGAAIVAGVVSDLLYMGVPPDHIREIIVFHGDDLPPMDFRHIGGGMLNAEKAIIAGIELLRASKFLQL